MPKTFTLRVRLVEVGIGQTPRHLALYHFSLGRLGDPNGAIFRQRVEGSRYFLCHQTLDHQDELGSRVHDGCIKLLVLDHQHNSSPP
ncbi:hypothetical protein ACFX2G_034593 [Malus domestica]